MYTKKNSRCLWQPLLPRNLVCLTGRLFASKVTFYNNRQKAVSSILEFTPTASCYTPNSVPHIECATIMEATSTSSNTFMASRLGKFLASKTGKSKWLRTPLSLLTLRASRYSRLLAATLSTLRLRIVVADTQRRIKSDKYAGTRCGTGRKMKCGNEIEQNGSSPDVGPKDMMPPAARDLDFQLEAGCWLWRPRGFLHLATRG